MDYPLGRRQCRGRNGGYRAGSTVAGIQARQKIDPGHKIALTDIPLGAAVVKYGQAIGRTTAEVKAGDHVHSHNLHFENDRLAATANSAPEEATAEDKARSFMGYRRADGRAATRNYIGIIASVNCSTTVCRAIATRPTGRSCRIMTASTVSCRSCTTRAAV